MSKGITRTIVSQEIEIAKFENGELQPLQSIIVDKEITHEEAVKLVSKKYKGEQVIVTCLTTPKEEKRRISLEDFIAHSEVIGSAAQEELEELEVDPEYQESL